MTSIQGRSINKGIARAMALVSATPINITASFTKLGNIYIPGQQSVINDRHHELYRENVKGQVLVFPSCIGSTYSGMVLMQLICEGYGPAAIIVQDAEPLLTSGVILSDVWYRKQVPMVECRADDFWNSITTGDTVEVDGVSGRIGIITLT
jgi:uncharacterized protein